MKKDFQKFQNDFYAEVENRLPAFSEDIHTIMITDCEPESEVFLEVIFGFKDVTGKDRTESVLVKKNQSVADTVTQLNNIFKEDYPAWAHFTTGI